MLPVPTSRWLRTSRHRQVDHKLAKGRCAMATEGQIKPGLSFFRGGPFVKARRAIVLALLMAAALFCFIGVGHSTGSNGGRPVLTEDDHSTGISRAAIEKFWTIYHGNDYAGIPEAQDEL